MKLRIRHDTVYRYRRPVALQPHRLMLVPRSSYELTILSHVLRCTPTAELAWVEDVFGNLVATASFATPVTELIVSTDVVVEQSAPEWPVFPIAPAAHVYPFRYADEEEAALGVLLKPWHSDEGGQVAAWADSFVLRPITDTLSLLKDINAGIVGSVAYRTRDEEGTQSPGETLAIRSGSCRDIAALFIDAVRRLGFGARAVLRLPVRSRT